jgi:ditrans,polycis-polyprenyl diphosphate synthase
MLNLCMPYASRDEITTAVESAVNESLETGNEITEDDIERHLATSLVNTPPLDILIRTSGVKRLSDYLLWQVSMCICSFE